MAFYDLPKDERTSLVAEMNHKLASDYRANVYHYVADCFADGDTYIRKSAYTETGKLFFEARDLQPSILRILTVLEDHPDFKVRQTVINAAGEIGKRNFPIVERFFDKGLFDVHHSPRNAVIGSIKKMGEMNPTPVLEWAKKYLHHPDKEIRREICHGIELRGRTHPEDILPLLRELQFDRTARVRKTLVHVIGQIAYKKGCLAKVARDLHEWGNKDLVRESLDEIVLIHDRYRNFSAMTAYEAKVFLEKEFGVSIDGIYPPSVA